jgi:hypothetical protein
MPVIVNGKFCMVLSIGPLLAALVMTRIHLYSMMLASELFRADSWSPISVLTEKLRR